jgi:hypothetical protein|tara:strand:- start:8089 stop:8640 length:552 start_codon:yes stop_codon:yes gene_type:complete
VKKMSWRKILKKEIDFKELSEEVEQFQLEDFNAVKHEDFIEFYDKIGKDGRDSKELRETLDESEKKYLDKHIEAVFQGIQQYNNSLYYLGEALGDIGDGKEKSEKDPVPQLQYGNKNAKAVEAMSSFQDQYYENPYSDPEENRELSAFIAGVSRGESVTELEKEYPGAYIVFDSAGLLNEVEE